MVLGSQIHSLHEPLTSDPVLEWASSGKPFGVHKQQIGPVLSKELESSQRMVCWQKVCCGPGSMPLCWGFALCVPNTAAFCR